MNHIQQDFYLTLSTCSRTGYANGLSGNLTMKKPNLKRDQIAVKIKVKVPRSAFEQPMVSTTLTIDERHITQPELEIEAQETEGAA